MPKPSQTERLHTLLSHEIRTARVRPGQMLVEPEVAEKYGVSRTPARETLRLLASEGWLQVLPRKGYFVRPLELQDVSEVMQLRIAIEPALGAEAAKQSTPRLISTLRQLIDEQHEPGADREQQLDRAERFHLAVAEASGNRRAHGVLLPLINEISRLHHAVPKVADHVTSEVERQAHLDIADALEARDPGSTQALIREHLEESRTAMFAAF
ncbi:GntR family transcriptional regulator [Brevibacterium sp. UBA7493]|uniref:GntR family transcriptional regulator n=1 Tax=Brevibacterium sp. UBA7493 TaxID=1946121 RepID=UPI00257AF183|nr:GntR family transcriptional regulator [Brevibacterium sp. UBA7493]